MAKLRTDVSTAPIVVGLVNSMPGEARRHTEQQFQSLLSAACPNIPISLRFYALGAVSPSEPAYEDTARLEDSVPDAMIVTGAPPQAAALADEPYWPKMTELVDFAVDHAVPTLWSCLAAHAAVLYLDGIERRRLPEKLSGLYGFERTDTAHPILSGLPRRWRFPHSRYNELPEDRLAASGYRILSRSDNGGVDLFLKEETALFLFCQGHPEYDAQTLLREYRRDVRQFLAGGRERYPEMPHDYFAPEAKAALTAFRQRALRNRNEDLSAQFPTDACLAGLDHGWRGHATTIYANWMAHVLQQKVRRPAHALPPRALSTAAVPALGEG